MSLYLLRLSFYTRAIQPSVEILGAGEEEKEEKEEKKEEKEEKKEEKEEEEKEEEEKGRGEGEKQRGGGEKRIQNELHNYKDNKCYIRCKCAYYMYNTCTLFTFPLLLSLPPLTF